MDTNYTKDIFSHNSLVDYYDNITFKFSLLRSELLIFQKYVALEAHILDIGCGAGRTTLGLYKAGYHNIIGVDIAEAMIKRAEQNAQRANVPVYFQVGDAVDLHFSDNSFDCVSFSFNGIMSIPSVDNRIKACAEAFRVLKNGGCFIFSTPFLDNKIERESWQERLKETEIAPDSPNFGDMVLDDYGVEHIYMHIPFIKEVEEMLRKTHFTTQEHLQRITICEEDESVENELDDNMVWVAYKNE